MLTVLEGLDGAGKSTQVKKLRAYLESLSGSLEYIHFPRYDAPVYGDLISRFLRGDFGSNDAVHPQLVALLFAEDRHGAGPEMKKVLDRGGNILLDRYVYSNIAYQCAKLADEDEAEALRVPVEPRGGVRIVGQVHQTHGQVGAGHRADAEEAHGHADQHQGGPQAQGVHHKFFRIGFDTPAKRESMGHSLSFPLNCRGGLCRRGGLLCGRRGGRSRRRRGNRCGCGRGRGCFCGIESIQNDYKKKIYH